MYTQALVYFGHWNPPFQYCSMTEMLQGIT